MRMCVRGHVVAGDNLYVDPKGRHVCRECGRILQKRRKNRRSLSVRASTYRRLATLCERQGKTVSGFVEELLAPLIADIEDREPPKRPALRPTSSDPVADLRAIEEAFGARRFS